MKKLHINQICDHKNFVSKEEQRDLMCSNKESHRCSSLDITSQFISEDDAIDYLAELLVAAFLDRKRHAKPTKKSC